MNITDLNNTVSNSELTIAAASNKNAKQTLNAKNKPVEMLNRFDRYEGISASDGVPPVTVVTPENRGVFSENTSFEIGEKILREEERISHYEDTGFSAKHIISVFFNAEATDRYNRSYTYEYDNGAAHYPIHEKFIWWNENSPFTNDDVALIASQVGKYIDHCYEMGKYTYDEYAQLNDEIKKCSKAWLDQIVDVKVGYRLREQDKYLYPNGLTGGRTRTLEELREEERIMRKKVETEEPIDFDAFFLAVDKMRGKVTGINASNKESGSANVK